jgi:hypothetical protein
MAYLFGTVHRFSSFPLITQSQYLLMDLLRVVGVDRSFWSFITWLRALSMNREQITASNFHPEDSPRGELHLRQAKSHSSVL